MFKFLLIFILCNFTQARISKDLKVRIDDGRIIGRYLTTESGRTIRAFMGIPYAEVCIKFSLDNLVLQPTFLATFGKSSVSCAS